MKNFVLWVSVIVLAALVVLAPLSFAQPVTGFNTGSSPVTGSTGTFSGNITTLGKLCLDATCARFVWKDGSNNLGLTAGGGNNIAVTEGLLYTGANGTDGIIFSNEAEIQWPDTKIAEVGTQIVATAAGGFSVSTGLYAAGNTLQCTGTGTSCQLSTLTSDATTSASVPAYEFALGANLTAGDLGWAFRDNAGVYVAKIDEQGVISNQMGTSATGYATTSGIANVASTAVGNVGASGPDDLMTYTLPASALVTTNRVIRITAWGTCANNANAKTFTLNFGSQVILTHACTISVAGETWRIQSEVIRTGASAQDWFSTYYGSTGAAGAFEFDPEIGTATQTETGTIVIRMQTTVSTSNNDIVQEGMIVEYF